MGEWLSSLRLRLHALLRRRQLERDFRDELSLHLALREEELAASGAPHPDTDARRRLGNVTRIAEDLHDTWAVAPRVSAVVRDVRYAARALARTPGFTAVVVLTLGLGIGVNTAFFAVVNAVLIRPLGYAATDRLVSVHEAFPQAGVDRLPFSVPDFEDFRSWQQSFDAIGAYRVTPFEVSGSGRPERITGTKISAGLLELLGVAPTIGRTFSARDDRPGVHVAILSWRLWQRRFGADPSVVGQSIQLDREPYTIVGVMPPGFAFPRRGPQFNGEPADVWVPIAFTDRERIERGSQHNNSVVARLKPGASLQALAAELDVLAHRISAAYPQAVRNAGFSPRLVAQPLREEISGSLEAPLLMLLAAVGLVLLVVCANVANLILSRVTVRTREFAVRTALGARRGQVLQLLLCEAALLAVAGGTVALAVAYGALSLAPAVLTSTVPGLHDLSIDWRVLAFSAAMCLGTAMVFAVVPLASLDRRKPADSLRDDPSRATASPGGLRIQRGFVVVTVTLACVLLAGAGLLAKSFSSLVATDLGFRPAHLLAASVTLPRTVYTSPDSVRTFHESLSRSLEPLPGVRSVALTTNLPLTTYDIRAFTPEGAVTDTAPLTTNLTYVHGQYFETLGIALEKGRFFVPDEHARARGVVVVNEKLAALAWPGQDAVGKRLKWGGAASDAPWMTVVGVIRDVVDGPIGAERGVHAYEPFRQLPDFFLEGATTEFGRDVSAVILADGEPQALAAVVRDAIARLDPDLAIRSIHRMDDQIRDVVAPQRFSTWLVGAFAAMALLIAVIGIYGLLSFTTMQRQKEIAVRMAMGADRGAVAAMVIGQGLRLVAVGLAAGLVGSLALARVMASVLYQADPLDVRVFAIVPAVLAPAAFLACALPARRAARVEPTQALRAE